MENKSENAWVESKGKEFRENPKELKEVFYLFRHDPPIYGKEVNDEIKKHGFSGEKVYHGAQFKEEVEIPEISYRELPRKKKLKNISDSLKSEIIGVEKEEGVAKKEYNINDKWEKETPEELKERVITEGGIDEIKERKNLNYLAELIREKDFKPIILVGPRTRQLLTCNSVMESLKQSGINIDEPILAHTDKLTDINKHWLPLIKAAKELDAEDPWSLVKNPNFHEEMSERGIETMEEIRERMKKYLIVLERWWRKQSNLGNINKGTKPVYIGFTSDFEQRALLRNMGLEEIEGVKTNYFKSEAGSYVCVEVMQDESANIYYQPPNKKERKLLGSINNFRNILYGKNKIA